MTTSTGRMSSATWRRVVAAAISATALALLAPLGAGAAFPGANGRIAYVVTTGSTNEIHSVDPDGQNQLPLASFPNTGSLSGPSYSGDGERITFSRRAPMMGDVVFVMGADGQDRVPVSAGPSDAFGKATFSPDGQLIALERSDGDDEIFVMNADGSNLVQLTHNDSPDENPAFSPDGQQIVYEGRNGGSDSEIMVVNVDRSGEVALTDNAFGDHAPDYSPDGRRIVFVRDEGADNEILVMDAEGGGQAPLTENSVDDSTPVFSPDGQKVAFRRAFGVESDIYLMNADGSNQIPIVAGPDSAASPDWQPRNAPACNLTGKNKSRSIRRVEVAVLCMNENATATAGGQLTTKAPATRSAVAAKRKKVALGQVTAPIPRAIETTLTLVIPKKGRKALKKSGKAGKAAITVTLTDELGDSSTLAKTIKVKPKRKK